MISDNVCSWIKNLAPRISEYFYFNDMADEVVAKLDSLEGRDRTEYEKDLFGSFLESSMYSADFEPEPEKGLRIEKADDIEKLIETELDRKRFEKSLDSIFSPYTGEGGGNAEKEASDPYRDDFFRMMKSAFGINELYNSVEAEKTDAANSIDELVESVRSQVEEGAPEDEKNADEKGQDDLMSQLDDIINGHLDV